MDQDELKTAVTDLKRNLQKGINAAVSQFHGDTGLTPSAIEVHMIDVTTSKDAFAQFQVGQVWVGFKL